MVRNATDGQYFVPLVIDNGCHVLIQSFVPFWRYQRFSELDGEDRLYVNLGVGVAHSFLYFFEITIRSQKYKNIFQNIDNQYFNC
jgi:hypothetical protein